MAEVNFIEKIKSDMHSSMKLRDELDTKVLRVLLAKLKETQINRGKKLTEQDCLSVIKTLVKQRKEAAEIYKKANRTDLAEKEDNENKILSRYLPKMLTEYEIKKIVEKIIKENNIKNISQIGMAMPLIMKTGGGAIDGKIANQILRDILD
tara:strand:- start:69 stop:521 length:453 start_codon:yes stop_codon:yes gene_type:complete